MRLYINTKDQKKVVVLLKNRKKVLDEISRENQFGSQALLPLIEKILNKNKLKFSDLNSIEVEIGPGSFTGLRIGISVANALGYALKIPVNNKEMEANLKY